MQKRLVTYLVDVLVETKQGFATVQEKVTIGRTITKLGTVNKEWERQVVANKIARKFINNGFVSMNFVNA